MPGVSKLARIWQREDSKPYSLLHTSSPPRVIQLGKLRLGMGVSLTRSASPPS